MERIKKPIVLVVFLLGLVGIAWLAPPLGRTATPSQGSGSRITVVMNPADPLIQFALGELEAAARAKGLSIRRVPSLSEAESEPTIQLVYRPHASSSAIDADTARKEDERLIIKPVIQNG